MDRKLIQMIITVDAILCVVAYGVAFPYLKDPVLKVIVGISLLVSFFAARWALLSRAR